MIAHYYLCLCLLASFGLSARGSLDGSILEEGITDNAARGADEEPENRNDPGMVTFINDLERAVAGNPITKFGLKDACGEPLKETFLHTTSNLSQTMLTNIVKKAMKMYNNNAGTVSGLTHEDVLNWLKTHVKEAKPIVIPFVLSYATALAIYHELSEHREEISKWSFEERLALYQVIGVLRAFIGMFPFTTNLITFGVADVESLTQDGFGAGNGAFFSTTMPILSVFPLFYLSYYPTMADKFVRLIVSNPLVKLLLNLCSFVFQHGHNHATKTELMEYVAVGHGFPMFGTDMALLHFKIYPNLWNQLAFSPLGAAEEGVLAIAKQAMSNPDRYLDPIIALMFVMNFIQSSLVERFSWKSIAASFMLINVIFYITRVQESPIQALKDIFPIFLTPQITYAVATFAEYLHGRYRAVESDETPFQAMPIN